MLESIHPKYLLRAYPKEDTIYNPIRDDVDECIATIIDINEGERGWIAYYVDDSWMGEGWHRLHTSIIENITVDDEMNVIITTRNTKYVLHRLY